MVSEDTQKAIAGAAIIVGVLVMLYELAAMGQLTPELVGATLPVLGLGAALIVGGGAARAYVLRKIAASSGAKPDSARTTPSEAASPQSKSRSGE